MQLFKSSFYKIKFDNENTYQKSCIITKILKLDKNNQHGYAITKSLPTGCIKGHPSPMARVQPPSWNSRFTSRDWNLFVADIKFDEKRATEHEYMYNEILPPIIEKQILEANECLVYKLLELSQKTWDSVPKTYRCTKTSHATIFPKKYIQLYLEDLSFLIKQCCWRVTKIYTHYTFKQARFKRDFVLMNQKF